MDLESLTIGDARKLVALLGGGNNTAAPHPYKIGQPYLIRTVTQYLIGMLVEVTPQELVLEGESWVACPGRFAGALEADRLEEVEPYPDGRVIVGRGSITDAAEWHHPQPRKVIE